MASEREIRIGIGPRDYSSYRAFQKVPVPGVRFIREPYVPIRRIAQTFSKWAPFSQSAGLFIPTGRADLYHSYNAALLNRSPWVVSFECQFPRVWDSPKLSAFLLVKAAAPACKRVIAMSENAKLHLTLRNANDPSLQPVLQKTTVIHPFLEDDLPSFERRRSRNPSANFHIVFVGNHFFRKGGHFAVQAFERLKNHFNLRMTVVSTLSEWNDIYAVPPGSAEIWGSRMTVAGVQLKQNISGQEVRALLATSDVVVLPTLEDSFGYSMVEAMATGVAVVATAVEAVPEIVSDGETGTLLRVSVTEEGRIIWSRDVEGQMVDQLTAALKTLFESPSRLYEMGMQGRKRYERLFSPTVIGHQLAAVYKEATKNDSSDGGGRSSR